jgi:hypothetical protein
MRTKKRLLRWTALDEYLRAVPWTLKFVVEN